MTDNQLNALTLLNIHLDMKIDSKAVPSELQQED